MSAHLTPSDPILEFLPEASFPFVSPAPAPDSTGDSLSKRFASSMRDLTRRFVVPVFALASWLRATTSLARSSVRFLPAIRPIAPGFLYTFKTTSLMPLACGIAIGILAAESSHRDGENTGRRLAKGEPGSSEARVASTNSDTVGLSPRSAASAPMLPVDAVSARSPSREPVVQYTAASESRGERDGPPAGRAAQYRGVLAVRSSPPGARVLLNGNAVGVTPIVLADVPVGSRVVQMRLDGYQSWSSSVRVVAGQQTSVSASLVRASAP